MNNYAEERKNHWDLVAKNLGNLSTVRSYYHTRLKEIFQLNIPKGVKILELGCGNGDLLASLNPSVGVGVDFSGEMLAVARSQHPDLVFHQQDVQQLILDEKFDFIILSDLVNDAEDVQTVFEVVKAHSDSNTRIVLNFYSHLWSGPLLLAQKIGWATPTLQQNWLTVSDIKGLMDLAGLEPVRNSKEVL